MFCTNCGTEVKEGLKFCTNCGKKLEEEAPQEITPAPQIEKTEVMTVTHPDDVQLDVAQEEVKANSVIPIQNPAPQIKEAKSSKAPTVILVFATLIIIVGGVLASLAIIQPPIDFLKDTPFSSVKSENSTDKKAAEKEGEATEESSANKSEKKDDSSSNKSSTNSNSGGYVIADSSSRKLTEADIKNLTNDQISIAQNEIWARHGRKFKNKWLQEYFNKQSWYKGTIEPQDFNYTGNEYESANASFLIGILDSRGYRVDVEHPN